MKSALLAFLVSTTILILGVTTAAADSNSAALIVTLDEGCSWYFESNSSIVAAEGSVHYVQTQNGRWKLSCIGDIVDGLPLDKAIVINSTADNPIAFCNTPFGSTNDVHMTFSPSGKSNFVCHGDLTP